MIHKPLNPRDYLDKLYVARKEEIRGIVSIGDYSNSKIWGIYKREQMNTN